MCFLKECLLSLLETVMSFCESTAIEIESYHLYFVVPLIAFLSVTAISATLLNVLVILVIWKTLLLQSPSRILLCSLALTDLLVGVVVEPTFIVYCVASLLKWCDAFRITNVLTTRVGYGLATLSIATLLAIAVDRFLAIQTKARYKYIVTKKRSVISVILLWLVPGIAIALVVQFRKPSDKDTKIVVTSAVLFLLAIIALYAWCFKTLRKVSTETVRITNQSIPNRITPSFNTWKYRRSLVTMLIVVAAMLVSFLPVVFYFATHTLDEVESNPGLAHLCESFVLLNSTLNPMIYLWRMKDLRQALKHVVKNMF